MKTFKIIAVSMLVVPILALGQASGVELPNAGITPSSPFYFLNRAGEALQEFFTFNPEAKARLQLQFAAERISEIKEMLSEKGVTAPGIDVAKARLTENLSMASKAVEATKNSGKDIAELAKEVSDKISSQKLVLKSIFEEKDKDLIEQEKALMEQIKSIKKDEEIPSELSKNLSAIAEERSILKKQKEETSEFFDVDEEKEELELKEEIELKEEEESKEINEQLEELNRENEKQQQELDEEMQKLFNEIEESTSTF